MGRYLALRWLIGHVVVMAVAMLCIRLGWWQWLQARQGNILSYGYALQWPLFAAFGMFFWFRMVRDRLENPTTSKDSGTRTGTQRKSRTSDPKLELVWSFHPERAPEQLRMLDAAAPDESDTEISEELAYYNDYLAWLAADPDRRPADYTYAVAWASSAAGVDRKHGY